MSRVMEDSFIGHSFVWGRDSQLLLFVLLSQKGLRSFDRTENVSIEAPMSWSVWTRLSHTTKSCIFTDHIIRRLTTHTSPCSHEQWMNWLPCCCLYNHGSDRWQRNAIDENSTRRRLRRWGNSTTNCQQDCQRSVLLLFKIWHMSSSSPALSLETRERWW